MRYEGTPITKQTANSLLEWWIWYHGSTERAAYALGLSAKIILQWKREGVPKRMAIVLEQLKNGLIYRAPAWRGGLRWGSWKREEWRQFAP